MKSPSVETEGLFIYICLILTSEVTPHDPRSCGNQTKFPFFSGYSFDSFWRETTGKDNKICVHKHGTLPSFHSSPYQSIVIYGCGTILTNHFDSMASHYPNQADWLDMFIILQIQKSQFSNILGIYSL